MKPFFVLCILGICCEIALAVAPANFDKNAWSQSGSAFVRKNVDGMATLPIKLPKSGDLKLSYTIKLDKLSGDDSKFNRVHYGWIMNFKDGRKVQIYSWRNRATLLEEKNGQTIIHRSISDFNAPIQSGNEHTYELIWRGKEVEALLDGKMLNSFDLGTVRPESVNFYFYNTSGIVSGITTEQLPELAKENPLPSDGKAHFHLDPAQTSAANPRTGARIAPVVCEKVTLSNRSGAPVLQFGKESKLEYPIDFLGKSGTLVFWYYPDFNGMENMSDTEKLLTITDRQGQEILTLSLGHFLQATLRTPFQNQNLNQYVRPHIQKDTPYQIAVVWNENGYNTLYLNGSPIQHGQFPGPIMPQKGRVNFEGAAKIAFGLPVPARGEVNTFDGALGETLLFDSALSAEKVMALYRAKAPFDIMLDCRFVEARREKTVELIFNRALPYEEPAFKSAAPYRIQASLFSVGSGKTVELTEQSIHIDGRTVLPVKLPKLSSGSYHLIVEAAADGIRFTRSFNFYVYDKPDVPMQVAPTMPKGDPILTIIPASLSKEAVLANVAPQKKQLKGLSYLEAGPKKSDKFSFRIDFPNEVVGNDEPLLMTITYPDDAARSAGFYLFVQSPSPNHRDRLEGGIQTGDENSPVSGVMQSETYFFYPGAKSYLFEAKTMAENKNAAIAKIEFHTLSDAMTALPVATPPLPYSGRLLGHLDEDQSFEFTIGVDGENRYSPEFPIGVFKRLLNYFSYTGQNAISYPLLRYNYIYYDVPGQFNSVDIRFSGWPLLLLDLLESRNMKLLATVNSQNIPEYVANRAHFETLVEQGLLQLDYNGKPVAGGLTSAIPNVVHPVVRKQFLHHIEEMLLRYGNHPAFAGVDLWVGMWNFTNIQNGYDDYTVNLFARETGTKLPDFKGEERFRKRYDLLTSTPHAAKWLAWRADKATQQVVAIEQLIQKINPKLKLYVNLASIWQEEYQEGMSYTPESIVEYNYRKFSIDMAAIHAQTAAVIVPHRNTTRYRWFLHWDGTPTIANEIEYDPAVLALFQRDGQAGVWNSHTYFETWEETLDNKNYAAYFENADVKNAGRDFLRAYAFGLAAADAPVILAGGQTLAAMGRENLLREFAANYRALPAERFTSLADSFDPVTVRYLKEKDSDEAFFYLVNLTMGEATVTLKGATPFCSRPLADTKGAFSSPQTALQVKLKSFETFAGKLKGIDPESLQLDVTISPELTEYCRKELERYQSLLPLLANMSEKSLYETTLNAMQKAYTDGKYAEFQRLRGSRIMQQIPRLLLSADRELLARQQQLEQQGIYAVNCGASEYTTVGKTLFAPDKRFVPGGKSGHTGRGQKVMRDVTKMAGVDPELKNLFVTELYDFDSYRFAVPDGVYNVKLYVKVGYEPANKPDVFAYKLKIEGVTVREKLDLYQETRGDFGKYAVVEFKNIKVSDGFLDVEFSCDGDQTARVLNAIEVQPSK